MPTWVATTQQNVGSRHTRCKVQRAAQRMAPKSGSMHAAWWCCTHTLKNAADEVSSAHAPVFAGDARTSVCWATKNIGGALVRVNATGNDAPAARRKMKPPHALPLRNKHSPAARCNLSTASVRRCSVARRNNKNRTFHGCAPLSSTRTAKTTTLDLDDISILSNLISSGSSGSWTRACWGMEAMVDGECAIVVVDGPDRWCCGDTRAAVEVA